MHIASTLLVNYTFTSEYCAGYVLYEYSSWDECKQKQAPLGMWLKVQRCDVCM